MDKKLNENFILKKINYVPIACILIICIVSTLYVSYNYINNLKKEKESIEKNYTGFSSIQIEEKQQELEKRFDKQIHVILLIAIIIFLVLITLSILISKVLKSKFLNYINCFEEQVRENEKQILENRI